MPDLAVSGHGFSVVRAADTAIAASDLAIPAGRLTAIIGPNASGKSTLLAAVAGLVPLAAGRIDVLGDAPGSHPERVAFVLQSTTVNDVMPVTVAEVVAMGRYARRGMYRWMRPGDRNAVARAMERVDVTAIAGKHLAELSGGQRQRVFVAQGLAQEADLLLLDEPTTGLDVLSREAIGRAVADEVARGATVVVTTHDIAEAHRADHVVLMARRVHTEGPPTTALHPERLADAYGIGVMHLEDGSVVLDDAAHAAVGERHVHFERG